MLSFKQLRDILRNDKNWKTFEKAEIDGDMFLTDGDTPHFWHVECDLPAGPSRQLSYLVRRIKVTGRGDWRVGTDIMLSVHATGLHCYRANLQGTEPPQSLQRVKATNLYRLLGDKGKALRDRIFTTKSISVLTFLPDGSQDYSYTELSLRTSITEFLQRTPGGDPELWLKILPCKPNALVFRETYREMLDFIKGLEEEHGYMGEGKRPQRERTHSSIILTGNPGIGKIWFQSAILVDRLLAGLPTVLQTDEGRGDVQFLLSANTVSRLCTSGLNDPVYTNIVVWAPPTSRHAISS